MNTYYDNSIDLPEWNADSTISLNDLEKLIPKLKKKYGKNSVVMFYAGANNISALIFPSKKKVSKKWLQQ